MGEGVPLPDELREASGIAASRVHPGVFWSHGDSGSPPLLVAVTRDGEAVAKLELRGAGNRDWEDMAAGPCGPETCLYVGDTGDNAERRDDLVLYRVREPDALGDTALPAERYPISVPDGPRDMEALFVLPGPRVFFVTKGPNHPVELYRYPGTLRADTSVTLERVQFLSATPRPLPEQVTGASASADGRTVAVRTYSTLRFYRFEGGRLTEIEDGLVNLRIVRETQGEAVALAPDGVVALASEGGHAITGPGGLVLLRCEAR